MFDVGTLLEDTETKNAVLEHMEELQDQVSQVRAAFHLDTRQALQVTLKPGLGVNWALALEFQLNAEPDLFFGEGV